VLDAHRDHAETFLRTDFRMLEYEPHHLAHLVARALLLADEPRAVRNEYVVDDLGTSNPRERGEVPVVEVAVREGNQALVAASVMPFECPRRKQHAKRLKDRLESFDRGKLGCFFLQLGVLLLRTRCEEEGGRRKLFLVAGDDKLRAARDGRHRVGRTHLACLVEDHDVEEPLRWERLADNERAHHPTGLQLEQVILRSCEEIAKRKQLSLPTGLLADERNVVRKVLTRGGASLRPEPEYPICRRLEMLRIQVAVASDGCRVLGGVE
jgi:hypothetical protein